MTAEQGSSSSKYSSVSEGEIQFAQGRLPAEQIAILRMRIENRITSGQSPTMLQPDFERDIAFFPDALPYKPYFDSVLKYIYHGQQELDKLWEEEHNGHQSQERDRLFEYTTQEVAQRLYNRLYPDKEVAVLGAEKGPAFLGFILEDDPNSTNSGFVIHGRETLFPVVQIYNSSYQNSPRVQIHEIEHVKNIYLLEGKAWDEYLMWAGIEPKLHARIKRRNNPESIPQWAAKDEILSHFSQVAINDLSAALGSDYTESPTEGLTNWLLAISLDPEEELHASREEYTQIEDDIFIGVQSLATLYQIYLDLGLNSISARMAINVLEQFPLSAWPEVVNLIEKRNEQLEESENL